MADVMTIREAVKRAKGEGLPVSEYTLRRWVRDGVIPARMIGSKALIFYPNLVAYIRCDGGTPSTAEVDGSGISERKRGVYIKTVPKLYQNQTKTQVHDKTMTIS